MLCTVLCFWSLGCASKNNAGRLTPDGPEDTPDKFGAERARRVSTPSTPLRHEFARLHISRCCFPARTLPR
eukprot:9973011-Alexandrium_andersonii.AAC.1